MGSYGGVRKFFYGWIVLSSSFLTMFMVFGLRNTFGVFFNPFQMEFSWSRASISLAMSIGLMVSGLFLIVWGDLVDRFGPKRVILISVPIFGASLLLQGMITHIWHLYLLFGVVGGLGYAGAGLIANTALMARWFVKKRGFAMSLCQSGFPLGQLILVPIAAHLILTFGWRVAYVILGCLILVVLLPTVSILVKDDPEELGHLPDGETEESESNLEQQGRTDPSIVMEMSAFEVVKTRSYLLLIPIYFICGFTDIPIATHLVPFALDMGLSEMMAANALGLVGGATLVGTVLMGRVSDRFGRKKPLAMMYALRWLSLLLLLGTRDAARLFVVVALFGFVFFSMVPLVSAWIGDMYGKSLIGKLFGSISLIHSVGAALGTYIDGVIFDLSKSYHYAFLIAATLALVASISCLFLRERPVEGC
ncbi:MAG: MFS transporter [Candidatus Geothermarchaeales archaeon]